MIHNRMNELSLPRKWQKKWDATPAVQKVWSNLRIKWIRVFKDAIGVPLFNPASKPL
jgi:hypothetical protein